MNEEWILHFEMVEIKSKEYFMTHESCIKIAVHTNKFLLEYSHAHLFTYYLWLFMHYSEKLCSHDRDYYFSLLFSVLPITVTEC